MNNGDIQYCPMCKADRIIRVETGQMENGEVESAFCAKCNTFLSSTETATGEKNGTL